MPIILNNLDDVTREVKLLWDQLDLLRTKNMDLSRRRVINASRSLATHDYIIREELDEVRSLIPDTVTRLLIPPTIEEPPTVVLEFKRIYTKLTLTEDTTIDFPDVIVTGDSHAYKILMDDVGGHLLTWASGFDKANLWPISRVADTYNTFEFLADSDDQKLYLNGFPVIGQGVS